MPPPIPDRWIPYSACGKVIEGTRIICFKVPLRKWVQAGKSEIKEIWDIKALVEKIPNLGAVIDLTNTSRYYDPRELQSAREGILYQKILMPGRVIPPEDSVQLFMDTVDEFLGKDCVAVQVKKARLGLPTADSLVGVHCTHGLNRTGYMVCRYMRDRLNIPAKTAIKRFEKARGYKIERANYIADLLGEEPPPADTGKFTKVKPISEAQRDRRPLRKNNVDEDTRSNRSSKYNNEKFKRKSENKKGERSKEEYNNWRTEDRETTRYDWNKDKTGEKSSLKRTRNDSEKSYDKDKTGEKGHSRRTRTDSDRSYDKDKFGENSHSKRNRTDSERSYDFRSKFAEDMNDQKVDEDRKKRRQEKKERKRKNKQEIKKQEKLAKIEEDRQQVRKKKRVVYGDDQEEQEKLAKVEEDRQQVRKKKRAVNYGDDQEEQEKLAKVEEDRQQVRKKKRAVNYGDDQEEQEKLAKVEEDSQQVRKKKRAVSYGDDQEEP